MAGWREGNPDMFTRGSGFQVRARLERLILTRDL